MSNEITYPLTMYQCIQLLECLIDGNVLHRDPNNQDNILVYRSAGTESPEGWYSENILNTATELAQGNVTDQKFLIKTIKEKGLKLELKKEWWKEN